jgi:hypothetical protein
MEAFRRIGAAVIHAPGMGIGRAGQAKYAAWLYHVPDEQIGEGAEKTEQGWPPPDFRKKAGSTKTSPGLWSPATAP